MRTDFLPLDLYTTHLRIINGISFTRREIDIISFLCSGRGSKAIAYSLSISPKTVETHLHNVMLKLGCNSREGIINFTEKFDKHSAINRHYYSLLAALSFDKSLSEIAKIDSGNSPSCIIIYEGRDEAVFSLVSRIELHLKKVNFKISVENREISSSLEQLDLDLSHHDCVFYCLSEFYFPTLEQPLHLSSNIFFLILNEEWQPEFLKNLPSTNVIKLTEQTDYYLMIFEILQKLCPHSSFDVIVTAFRKQSNGPHFSPEVPRVQSLMRNDSKGEMVPFKSLLKTKLKRKKRPLVSAFLVMGTCALIFFTINQLGLLQNLRNHLEIPSIRSDLVLPSDQSFLDRPELLEKIHNAFQRKEGIQTVALVGIGGSGKTTLARQYAHQQRTSIIWEINAETTTSLMESLENLANALAITTENKRALNELQETKNSIEREKKLVQFVKAGLRKYSNWCLIYDNVEKFTDIQKYFPLDAETWGQGRIILTTRDSNIQNNKYVNHTLQIGELNKNQKLNLFTKIINQGAKNTLSLAQTEEARMFLESIPPFPLDISVASYYIKIANVSYKKYLEELNKNSTNFENVQEDILKESGEYTRTRYGIVTLFLHKLIERNKDFSDLLLFISLIYSQNIPKGLLNLYKDSSVVDNFIYELKKHSLITTQSSPSSIESSLSIHRSTQAIILAYLEKVLNFKKNNALIQTISNTLENYTTDAREKEDFLRMRLLVSHCEKFVSHRNLLGGTMNVSINGELGGMYYHLGNYIKAKQHLDKSLADLASKHPKSYARLARILIYLGIVYRELGNHEQAKVFLERSLKIYHTYLPGDHIDIAWALGYLGNVYRSLGEYEKAKNVLEQSLLIFQDHLPQNQLKYAWILTFLGIVYKELGSYEKAENILKQSLIIHEKFFPDNQLKLAWVSANLGNVYRIIGKYKNAKQLLEQSHIKYQKHFGKDHHKCAQILSYLGDLYKDLGDYEKAKDLVEKSLLSYKEHFHENHIWVGWVSARLGSIYGELHNYKKAKHLLEKSLLIFKENYGEDNIETARILRSLGKIYLLEDNLETSEILLKTGLKIFQNNKHPDNYMCLYNLGELYLKKYNDAEINGNMQKSKSFKKKAIAFLVEALSIAQAHFPKDSPNIARIQAKLDGLK